MADIIVREWLADYKAISSSEIHSFANIINENYELLQALFTIFEEKKYHQEFLDPVCHQLFSFYRSSEKELKQFALQYIPSLIGLYLCIVSRGERKNFRCIEVLLLSIYNLEVVDSLGKPVVQSFRIPSIAKPSIYHEPISLSHSVLTEHALSKLEYGDNRSVTIGPFPEVEKINATNRLQVMTILMRVYNQDVGAMSKFSHTALCKMCSKTVRQGYPRINVGLRLPYNTDASVYPNPRTVHRIPVSSPFLLELVHGVYFSMAKVSLNLELSRIQALCDCHNYHEDLFGRSETTYYIELDPITNIKPWTRFNGLSATGLQAMEDLHFRATQELLSDVILVTNGIRNSLKVNPSGQPNDGPMGISIALSPTTTTNTVSKTIITNASFRTKKLPDDIPIQKEENSKETRQLGSICEENETSQHSRSTSGRNRRSTSAPNNTVNSTSKLPKDKKSKKEITMLEMNLKTKDLSTNSMKPYPKNKGVSDIKRVLTENAEVCIDEINCSDSIMEKSSIATHSGENDDGADISSNYEPESLGEAMSCVSPIAGYPMDSIGNLYVKTNGHGLETHTQENYYMNSVDGKDLESNVTNQPPLHQQTVV